MKLFNLDSPLMTFLTKLADLMILNLLWMVCSLPIITIGASTAAMYDCLLNQDRVSSITGTFFSAFKSNFKKATLLWLIQAVMTAVAAFDLLSFFGAWADAALVVRGICLIPAVWLLMSAGYLLPLQAQFENTVGNTLKNAILISIANLPVSLAVTVLNLLPVLLFLFKYGTVPENSHSLGADRRRCHRLSEHRFPQKSVPSVYARAGAGRGDSAGRGIKAPRKRQRGCLSKGKQQKRYAPFVRRSEITNTVEHEGSILMPRRKDSIARRVRSVKEPAARCQLSPI